MNKDRTLPKAWESIDSLIIASKNKFNTINDLKVANIIPDTVVETIGKDTITDGLGSKYIIKETDIPFGGNNILLNNGMYACEIPDTRVSNILRDEYQIKYQNIGNIETETNILIFAETADLGNYRSIDAQNKFAYLPPNIEHGTGAFELEITSIDRIKKYRTLKLKYYNSNDIWINTNTSDDTSMWTGWVKILSSSDNIVKSKQSISTKEEADVLFTSMNNISDITGFFWINNFNTCFPNSLNPQPYNGGIVKSYALDRYIIQTYSPHAQWLDFNSGLYKRIGTKATNSNIITWGDWSYENQQIVSNDNGQVGWVKFIDGTLIQTLRNIDISTYNNGTRIAFPIAFVGVPSVSLSDNNNGQNFQIQISPSLSDFALYNVEQRIQHSISILAIGRWR